MSKTQTPIFDLGVLGSKFVSDVQQIGTDGTNDLQSLLKETVPRGYSESFPTDKYVQKLCEKITPFKKLTTLVLEPLKRFREACDKLRKISDQKDIARAIAAFFKECMNIVPSVGTRYLFKDDLSARPFDLFSSKIDRTTVNKGIVKESWWNLVVKQNSYKHYFKRELQEMVHCMSAVMPLNIILECYMSTTTETSRLDSYMNKLQEMVYISNTVNRAALLLIGIDTVQLFDGSHVLPARCALNPMLFDAGIVSLVIFTNNIREYSSAGDKFTKSFMDKWTVDIKSTNDEPPTLQGSTLRTRESLQVLEKKETKMKRRRKGDQAAFDKKSKTEEKTEMALDDDDEDDEDYVMSDDEDEDDGDEEELEDIEEDELNGDDGDNAQVRKKEWLNELDKIDPEEEEEEESGRVKTKRVATRVHYAPVLNEPTETRPEIVIKRDYSTNEQVEKDAIPAIKQFIESIVQQIRPKGDLSSEMTPVLNTLDQIKNSSDFIALELRRRCLNENKKTMSFGALGKRNAQEAGLESEREGKQMKQSDVSGLADVFTGQFKRVYRCGLMTEKETYVLSRYLSAIKREYDGEIAEEQTQVTKSKKKAPGGLTK